MERDSSVGNQNSVNDPKHIKEHKGKYNKDTDLGLANQNPIYAYLCTYIHCIGTETCLHMVIIAHGPAGTANQAPRGSPAHTHPQLQRFLPTPQARWGAPTSPRHFCPGTSSAQQADRSRVYLAVFLCPTSQPHP